MQPPPATASTSTAAKKKRSRKRNKKNKNTQPPAAQQPPSSTATTTTTPSQQPVTPPPVSTPPSSTPGAATSTTASSTASATASATASGSTCASPTSTTTATTSSTTTSSSSSASTTGASGSGATTAAAATATAATATAAARAEVPRYGLPSGLRVCAVSGKGMDEADLGQLVHVAFRKRPGMGPGTGRGGGGGGGATEVLQSALGDVEICPAVVSRVAYNESVVNNIPLQYEGVRGSEWLPLLLRKKEHGYRMAGCTLKTASKRSQARRYSGVSVFIGQDISGSMSCNLTGSLTTRLQACQENLTRMLTTELDPNATISFYTFSNTVTRLMADQPLATRRAELLRVIRDMQENGSTHFYRAVNNMVTDGAESVTRTGMPAVVAVFTDGDDTDSSGDLSLRQLKATLQRVRDNHVALTLVIIAPLGSPPVLAELVTLAPEGSELLQVDVSSRSDIGTAFASVGKKIISKQHGGDGTDDGVYGTMDLVESALSVIATGENGHFDPKLMWAVSAKLLCTVVLRLSKAEINLSQKTLQTYCDIHRTLLEFMAMRPEIKQDLLTTMQLFTNKSTPQNRLRSAVPNLGEAIQVLSLLDETEMSWEQFSPVFMPELFRRNAKWHSMTNSNRPVAEQLSILWEGYKISMLLIAFNVLFVKRVVHVGGRTLADLCRYYDGTLEYVTPEQLAELVGRFERLRLLSSFNAVMTELGLPSGDNDVMDLVSYGFTYVDCEKGGPTPGERTIQPSRTMRNYTGDASSSGVKPLEELDEDTDAVLRLGRITLAPPTPPPPGPGQTCTPTASASMYSSPVKRKMLHAGWAVTGLHTVPAILALAAPHRVNSKCYTAVVFGADTDPALAADCMSREGQTVPAVIVAIRNSRTTGLVADIAVEGNVMQMNLSSPTGGMKPHEMKRAALGWPQTPTNVRVTVTMEVTWQ
ncbi:hypothetical protein Pelo_8229 [Pelomyxa schiedti]|nr:hypothetical protein Pelo_8229 [Pelomyxa schiedti]